MGRGGCGAALERNCYSRYHLQTSLISFLGLLIQVMHFISQLLAMDASARITMKDAAKCDKRREWQNSANQENAERILHFQVIPESMSASGW